MRSSRTSLRAIGSVVLAISLIGSLCNAAGPKNKMPNPDFTAGDSIPSGAKHDWTLGPTGARGWMFSDRMVTTQARQIAITEVEPNTPADGVLRKGDVILGVDGQPFSFDPRTEFGRAVTRAETEAAGGKLDLLRWREGETQSVTLTLPVLGSYSATAPYDCPKSSRILEQGCRSLAERMTSPKYRGTPITRSLNGLALLASGNDSYLPLIKREAEDLAKFETNGYKTWHYGYIITFLSEYVIATGDESIMPGLRRLVLEAAHGQSLVGSWGHRFAQPDGRLKGYGMMNSPGVPLTLGLVLARKAGVNDPAIDLAIERSVRLLRFYIGKGAIPYGDHHPWTQTHEDNGKCGMVAVLFDQIGDAEGAEFFAKMSTASHGSERDTGHTGNFFNLLWAMPGITRAGPQASGAWMREYGAWYFDLARGADGMFAHQGPPSMRGDSYRNWDSTGAYLLAYAMPLKRLSLTGKSPSPVRPLTGAEANSLIEDGRGWDNRDRNSAYDAMTDQELLTRLQSWSPTVRERSAMALARRKAQVVPELISLLDTGSLEARYGACEALAQLRGASKGAVPSLTKALESDDLWLRVKAAEALAAIGPSAMPTLPKLLEMIAEGPTETDPRGMQQRYLCFAVFGQMLRQSLFDVDRELLRKAVAAGLDNQDGRARGSIGNVYRSMKFEEIKPLLPAIRDAVAKPAPSGVMFASGIRLAGLDVLAEHRIAEGLPLCLEVMEIDKWGKQERIRRCLKSLDTYGAAAKPLLPQLRTLERDLTAHREAKGMQSQIAQLRGLIERLEAEKLPTPLRRLSDLELSTAPR